MSFLMDFRNEVLARSRCAIDDRVDRLNRYYAIVFIIACVFFLSTKNIVGKQIFCFTPERFTLTQVRLSLRKLHNDEMCDFGMSFTTFDSKVGKRSRNCFLQTEYANNYCWSKGTYYSLANSDPRQKWDKTWNHNGKLEVNKHPLVEEEEKVLLFDPIRLSKDASPRRNGASVPARPYRVRARKDVSYVLISGC